jgi:hypothetical protein
MGGLRFIIGRADPGFFIGTHWLQSVDVSFMNRHFSGHPSMVAPGDTPLAGLSIRPRAGKLFYVTAATSNAYGETTKIELGSLFNHWDLFTFGEVGITPTFDKIGSGRYSVGVWHMPNATETTCPRTRASLSARIRRSAISSRCSHGMATPERLSASRARMSSIVRKTGGGARLIRTVG